MTRTVADLGPVLPALFDAMTNAQIGVVVFGYRNERLEKWYANAAAVNDLGYTVDEWLAQPAFGTVAPSQRVYIAQLYDRLVTGKPTPVTFELSLIHREGHEVTTEVSAGSVDLPDGAAIVVVFREVGAYGSTHLSLLEADRIALVGALAAGFAHETNNPLTSVLLNLRSLRKQLVANLAQGAQLNALRCLDDVTTAAERIASNVRALQTLATRAGRGQIDLAAVVSAALRLAAPTLEPLAHVIRQIFPVRPVAGEESRIGQAVLAMLLFSASGFDSEVPNTANRIIVAVEERADTIIVEVSDNGRDLTPDDTRRAFDPFYRSSVRGAGVGVGLGVARSVAATLGGDVTLAPRSGGGAVITMRLPPDPA